MGSWRSELLRRHTLDLATTIWPHDQGIVTFALATASAVACLWMASFLFLQFSYSYLSSRRDASNSLLARGKSAMSIYRRKLKPILQKRAARSYCSLPPRRSACSINHRQRRLDFFTLPVKNNSVKIFWSSKNSSHLLSGEPHIFGLASRQKPRARGVLIDQATSTVFAL